MFNVMHRGKSSLFGHLQDSGFRALNVALTCVLKMAAFLRVFAKVVTALLNPC
ncbi:MAG: hypothetical protein ACI9CO_001406 [Candidatus Azotimanducaceae bacterium]|jgi:hypothetical protein